MKRLRLAVLAAIGLTLALAVTAQATEVTRDDYTAKVEPICKVNTIANEKIFKGVKAEVRAGKLKPASVQFAKAATALKKTLAQLRAVPQPSADQAKLTMWLGYVKAEAELFSATSKKLKAGDKHGAEALVVRLNHNANLANVQVLAFGFRYCRFDTSKFT